MKISIKKVLIISGLLLLVPVFGYAASVSCFPGYANDLIDHPVNIYATIAGGNADDYTFSWSGDEDPYDSGQQISKIYAFEGIKSINVTATNNADPLEVLDGSCSVIIYTDATLPDLSASCSPNTDRAVIGQNITWTPNINGPLEPYSIVWIGEELDSTEYSPVKAYAYSGDKTATMVSFQSRYGGDTPLHNSSLSNVACAGPVDVVPEEIHNPPELVATGTCAAEPLTVYFGEPATWASNLQISGGVPPYVILWTDNEGTVGTGDSVTKTYSTLGIKSARLAVLDDAGQSAGVYCGDLSIVEQPENPPDNPPDKIPGGLPGVGPSPTLYTIIASAGGNGSISPAGESALYSGNSQTYTITPDEGYKVSDVLVDGVSVGAVTTYTFSDISSNHTISATFLPTGEVAGATTDEDSQQDSQTGAPTGVEPEEQKQPAGNQNQTQQELPSNAFEQSADQNQEDESLAESAGAELETGGQADPESNVFLAFAAALLGGLTSFVATSFASLIAIGAKWFNYLLIIIVILIILYVVYRAYKKRKTTGQV